MQDIRGAQDSQPRKFSVFRLQIGLILKKVEGFSMKRGRGGGMKKFEKLMKLWQPKQLKNQERGGGL